MKRSDDPVRRNTYLLFLSFWVIALGVAFAGYQYYLKPEGYDRKRRADATGRYCDLKVQQIQEWRQERLADGRVLMASPVPEAAREFLADTHLSPARLDEIRGWLEAVPSASGYANVILVNPALRLWTAVGESIHSPERYFSLARHLMQRNDVAY